MNCRRCGRELFLPRKHNDPFIDKTWGEEICFPHTDSTLKHQPAWAAPLRPEKLNQIVQAHKLLKQFANPMRHGMPLNDTETVAAIRAAQILRGR